VNSILGFFLLLRLFLGFFLEQKKAQQGKNSNRHFKTSFSKLRNHQDWQEIEKVIVFSENFFLKRNL
jgi:hypothetical protein